MVNGFKGYLRFNAEGNNLYKFINSIHKNRIYCFNQYCSNNIFYGEIYKRDKESIIDLAEKYDINIEFSEIKTVSSCLRKYKFRYGAVIGAVISIIICFYFSNTVMNIEITGNSKVEDGVILSVLEECGLKKGTFLNNIDYGKCERELRICIKDISWTAIRHTGNRIVVDIREITDIPDMNNTRLPCNIIADKTAQITSTSVFNGQLMRIVGDYVRKGDVLVSGVYDDAHGHTIKSHSMAEIIGIYEEKVSFIQPLKETVSKDGKNRNENYLNLFNLNIPLYIGKNKFDSYSINTQINEYSLFKRKLPISITKNTITEQIYTEKDYTDEEAKKLIDEKIFIYEKNFLENKKILNRDIKHYVDNNELHADVIYSIEADIGIKSDIFIK